MGTSFALDMRLLSPQSVLRCINNVGSTWSRNSSGTALTPALRQLRKARRVARLVLGGAQPKPGDLVQERSCETLIEIYPQMPLSERNSFIHMLSHSYKAVPESIQASIAEWQASEGHPEQQLKAQHALRHALRPEYEVVMNQIKRMPGGMKFLVDLRAEILQELRAEPTAELKAMEADLRRMLLSWFRVGALQLHRLQWHQTPAS